MVNSADEKSTNNGDTEKVNSAVFGAIYSLGSIIIIFTSFANDYKSQIVRTVFYRFLEVDEEDP